MREKLIKLLVVPRTHKPAGPFCGRGRGRLNWAKTVLSGFLCHSARLRTKDKGSQSAHLVLGIALSLSPVLIENAPRQTVSDRVMEPPDIIVLAVDLFGLPDDGQSPHFERVHLSRPVRRLVELVVVLNLLQLLSVKGVLLLLLLMLHDSLLVHSLFTCRRKRHVLLVVVGVRRYELAVSLGARRFGPWMVVGF